MGPVMADKITNRYPPKNIIPSHVPLWPTWPKEFTCLKSSNCQLDVSSHACFLSCASCKNGTVWLFGNASKKTCGGYITKQLKRKKAWQVSTWLSKSCVVSTVRYRPWFSKVMWKSLMAHLQLREQLMALHVWNGDPAWGWVWIPK